MKSTLKITGMLLAGIAGIIVVLVLIFMHFFFNINRLPEGEFLTEERSPTGAYTVKTYVTNGDATVAYAVRGEGIINDKKDKKKNIYWQYREDKGAITWLGDHTVLINDVELDVRKDVYDFRKE